MIWNSLGVVIQPVDAFISDYISWQLCDCRNFSFAANLLQANFCILTKWVWGSLLEAEGHKLKNQIQTHCHFRIVLTSSFD